MNRSLALTLATSLFVIFNSLPLIQSKNLYRFLLTPPNYFTVRLYQKLAENATGNIISSPLSTQLALAVLAIGTRGKTFDQLRPVLNDLPVNHYVDSSDDFAEDELPEGNLHLSNQLFISNEYEVKPEYIEAVKSFRSGVQRVDFYDTKLTSYKINTWCEQNTNGRLKDFVSQGSVYRANLILTNTVYFKGEWVHTFPQSLTKLGLFNVNEKTSKVVTVMRQRNIFNYGFLPEVDSTYIKLPYRDAENSFDDTSMYIILPNKLGGVRYAEQNLHKVSFYSLHLSDNFYRVQLTMPKFKFESYFYLNNAIKALRISDIFTTRANFSGIADSLSLKVDQVLQKTYIEVDEKGTEAASASAAAVVTSDEELSGNLPHVFMDINHPFLVVITSGPFVVFGGRVVDPSL